MICVSVSQEGLSRVAVGPAPSPKKPIDIKPVHIGRPSCVRMSKYKIKILSFLKFEFKKLNLSFLGTGPEKERK
jgi:hypothetical protein